MRGRAALQSILILSCLSIAAPGHASPRRTAVLAGAFEETGRENFFLKDLRELKARLVARGWSVTQVAGPGQAANGKITRAVLRSLGAAAAGDQVLLLFHAHGRERESEWGQKSHSISTEDRDPDGSEPGLDLDFLEKPIRAATLKGVRVALVDLSCYSGWTQALQGPACTLTLAAPDYVSLCSGRPEEHTFVSALLKLPPAGKRVSLEEQFLRARRADGASVNLPEISSREYPARAAWNELLSQVDPLDIFEDLRELRTGGPAFDPAVLLKTVPGTSVSRPRLKATLERVLKTRAELEAGMRDRIRDLDERSITLTGPSGDPVSLSVGSLQQLLRAAASGSPRDREGMSDVQRRLADSLATRLDAVQRQYGRQLDELQGRQERWETLLAGLEAASADLLATERAVYDEIARPRGGACREFEL
jgi:hypothetical protein